MYSEHLSLECAAMTTPCPPVCPSALIGKSRAMQRVQALVAQVAPTQATVLVTGPSGSGKEVVARMIHDQSARRAGAFVPVNCGAIPGDLLESELFGHEKGAFTGAISQRDGKFEAADCGTLFLDEIGDMPLGMQVKLLRVLEERRIERVGSNKSRHVDIRLVSATHRDLPQAIGCGQFREDLFYRLNIFPIRLPALCERREDVVELLHYFTSRFLAPENLIQFSADAEDYLTHYAWPGNVRELRNFVERAAILHPGRTIDKGQASLILRLGRDVMVTEPVQMVAAPGAKIASNIIPITSALSPVAKPEETPYMDPSSIMSQGDVDLRELLADLERSFICAALAKCQFVVADAARLLRLQRTTLVEKMRKYDIERAA
jgi:sigma-54 dependent transcriptional regulator, flagellar regulatory protein